MATVIEVDGVRIECDNAKHAAKCLREAARKAKKEHDERMAFGRDARTQAECKAYRILWRKSQATDEARAFPCGWRLYQPHHAWAKNMFRPLPVEFGRDWKHEIHFECGWVAFDHYGMDLIGVVCGGAGWAMAIVLRDRTTQEQTVYAVGAAGGQVSLADCPGIAASDFQSGKDE